jgi:hypothetical protein
MAAAQRTGETAHDRAAGQDATRSSLAPAVVSVPTLAGAAARHAARCRTSPLPCCRAGKDLGPRRQVGAHRLDAALIAACLTVPPLTDSVVDVPPPVDQSDVRCAAAPSSAGARGRG